MVRNTSYVAHPHTSGGHDYYHWSEDIADDAIHWLREQKAYAPDKPFFMYWAPGASHGPHQVMKEGADKYKGYKGKFDDGWDAYRERVFAKQRALGYIPPNAQPTPRAQFHHVNDIVPTLYEVLGIQPPQVVNGVLQDKFDGVSMVYTFDDPDAKGKKSTQFFDIMASRGVFAQPPLRSSESSNRS